MVIKVPGYRDGPYPYESGTSAARASSSKEGRHADERVNLECERTVETVTIASTLDFKRSEGNLHRVSAHDSHDMHTQGRGIHNPGSVEAPHICGGGGLVAFAAHALSGTLC